MCMYVVGNENYRRFLILRQRMTAAVTKILEKSQIMEGLHVLLRSLNIILSLSFGSQWKVIRF